MTTQVNSPWANGLVERTVSTVKGRLRHMALDTGRLNVSNIEAALNSAINDAMGHTPNDCILGLEMGQNLEYNTRSKFVTWGSGKADPGCQETD